MPDILPLLLLGCLTLLAAKTVLGRQRQQRLPPGPPGLPSIGNTLDLPKSGREWIAYQKWGREYSKSNTASSRSLILTTALETDVIHLRFFGTSVIVLNTIKGVQELFEKRSNHYSGR